MKTLLRSSTKNKVSMKRIVIIISFMILAIVCFLSLTVGRYPVSMQSIFDLVCGQEVPNSIRHIILNLRLPRLLAALLVGGALAASGLIFQSIFQNPLVSPDMLGVSSGACVGAAISIILGLNESGITVFSFLIGIISVVLCLSIARLTRNRMNLILVFSGIIIGRFMDSIVGLLKYFADNESQLGDIVNWQMGSMAKIQIAHVRIMAVIILPCMAALILYRWRLNLFAVGERDAATLGVNVAMERVFLIILSTLMTASAVCFCGTIAWVGLIIPHIARWVIGSDNRYTVISTIILGSVFLVSADLVARAATDYELPLGVITGFCGTPIFTAILLNNSRKVI